MSAAAESSASPLVRFVVVVVASVLVSLPMLLEADDPVAHALDSAAADISEPAKTWLREGAAIRRESFEVALDPAAALEAGKTWRSLRKLAETRIRLENSARLPRLAMGPPSGTEPYRSSVPESPASLVDQRIADHVKALAQTYSSAVALPD
jgi:hypothetical protein